MPGKTLIFGASVGPHAVAVTDDALADGIVTAALGDTPVVMARALDGGVRAFVARVDGEKISLSRIPGGDQVGDSGGSTWDLGNGLCVAGPRWGARLESVAVTPVYWFAWSGFYPNTQVIDR